MITVKDLDVLLMDLDRGNNLNSELFALSFLWRMQTVSLRIVQQSLRSSCCPAPDTSRDTALLAVVTPCRKQDFLNAVVEFNINNNCERRTYVFKSLNLCSVERGCFVKLGKTESRPFSHPSACWPTHCREGKREGYLRVHAFNKFSIFFSFLSPLCLCDKADGCRLSL